jgi:hypothetical protein
LWTSVFFVGLLLAVVLVRLVWLQGMDAKGYALAASDEKRATRWPTPPTPRTSSPTRP